MRRRKRRGPTHEGMLLYMTPVRNNGSWVVPGSPYSPSGSLHARTVGQKDAEYGHYQCIRGDHGSHGNQQGTREIGAYFGSHGVHAHQQFGVNGIEPDMERIYPDLNLIDTPAQHRESRIEPFLGYQPIGGLRHKLHYFSDSRFLVNTPWVVASNPFASEVADSSACFDPVVTLPAAARLAVHDLFGTA